jgi:hypothetical protein
MIERNTAEPVIRFLKGVTSDGELTSDEVWSLANWLNAQPDEVRAAWPGAGLVDILNTIFADGKVVPEEMEELALNIVSIQDLWAEQFAEKHDDAADFEVPETSGDGKVILPARKPAQLPSVPFKAQIEAAEIDLTGPRCTCSQWSERRWNFPEGDYRRACEHVIHAYTRAAADAGFKGEPLFDAFIHDQQARGGTSPLETWEVITISGKDVLSGSRPDREWINFLIPTKEGYHRYGYNKVDRRWSYGEAPRGIARSLQSLFA